MRAHQSIEYIAGRGGVQQDSFVMFEPGSNNTRVIKWDGIGMFIGTALDTGVNGEPVSIQVEGYYSNDNEERMEDIHLGRIVDEIWEPK